MNQLGLVKWFNNDKAFGVVATPDEEYFIHLKAFQLKPEIIEVGTPIIFEAQFDGIRKRNNAIRARLISNEEDFLTIIQGFGKFDKVYIQNQNFNHNISVKRSQRNNTSQVSLILQSIAVLSTKVSKGKIAEKLEQYFNNRITKENVLDSIRLCKVALSTKSISEGNSAVQKFFRRLGAQLDDESLFELWRTNDYKFVAPIEISEELPLQVLLSINCTLTASDILNIQKHSYWVTFFSHFIEKTKSLIIASTHFSLNNYFEILDTLPVKDRETFIEAVEPEIISSLKNDIHQRLNHHGLFIIDSDLQFIKELYGIIPYRLSNKSKSELSTWLSSIVLDNSDSKLYRTLWLHNIITPFPNEIIPFIIMNWTSTDHDEIIEALNRIKDYKNIDLINSLLYKTIKSINWSSTEAWHIYQSNEQIGRELLSDFFSFEHPSSVSHIRKLIETNANPELIRNLKIRFENQINNIDSHTIIEISRIPQFKAFNSINELLSSVVNKEIIYSDYIKIVEISSQSSNKHLVSEITKNVLSKESFETRLNCLFRFKEYMYITTPIMDILFKDVKNDLMRQHHNYFIESSTDSTPLHVFRSYLEHYGNTALQYFPNTIFALAVKCKHRPLEAESYSRLTFTNLGEFVDFTKLYGKLILQSEYKNQNRGLTNCLDYFINNQTFDLEAFAFISKCRGGMQTFIVKSFIYKYALLKISRHRLQEYLNQFEWTEISVVIVRAFVNSLENGETIILRSLQDAIKQHFDILNNQDVLNGENDFIRDNFSIENILPKCNGRKFYNVTSPTSSDPNRYFENKITFNYRESMDCFCEGIPWKKEIFFNRTTSGPSEEEVAIYWCRGNSCANRNDTIDLKSGYDKWTITEITKILNIQVEKVTLGKMAGWANKMNNIVERLFCRRCNRFLRPIINYSKFLGISPIPLFSCGNSDCLEYQKPIRFTHCINGKCPTHWKSLPLDSRDCENCHTDDSYNWGLQCNVCGAACPKCERKNRHVIMESIW